METIHSIYWHQGMFLQPQHFQFDALGQLRRLSALVDALAPDFWGFGELEIAQPALRTHGFEVRCASLRYPGGELLTHPGNALIGARRFEPEWLDAGRSLTVYLGLRALVEGQPNVTLCETTAAAAQADSRWAAQLRPLDVPDLYSDAPGAPVRTLQYVLRVFFEPEIEHVQDYELLPVARLVHDGDSPRLDAHFVPPCYALSGSASLQHLLEDMRDDVLARVRQLEELKGDAGTTPADATNWQFLPALCALTRAASALAQVCRTRHARPSVLYAGLRGLIAELSAFSSRCDSLGKTALTPGGLPDFDPLKLRGCFAAAAQVLELLLRDVASGPAYVLPMAPDGEGLAASVPAAACDRDHALFLMLDAPSAPASWAPQVAGEARLACPADIASLIAHALPGLALQHLGRVPPGVPRRAHSAHWRIGTTGRLWDAVQRDGRLLLHWPQAPQGLRASIIVVEHAS